MHKPVLLLVSLLVWLAIACNFSVSTANLDPAQLAKDEAGTEITTTFEQEDTFFLVVNLNNAGSDTRVRAVWTALDVEGIEPDFALGEKELVSGSGKLTFSFANDNLWPAGEYQVDLFLNDELNQTLTFDVEGDVVASTDAAAEETPPAEPAAQATAESEADDAETNPTVAAEPSEADATEEETTETDNADSIQLEPTAEPAGLLFADSFDSDINGWATGEFENDFNITEIAIADGVYSFTGTAKQPTYMERRLPREEFSDFVLTVEATPTDTEEHYSYGLAFRIDSDGTGYSFEVGNDGLYAVLLFDGEWQTLSDWTFTELANVGETNELMVVAEGETLSFFINGEALTTVQDATVSEGQIGLVVEIFEEGETATVEFDNLTVYEPDGLDTPDAAEVAEMPAETDDSAVTQADLLTFQAEPYVHPSGAFSFVVPEGWEIAVEDDTTTTFGGDDSALGAVFVDGGAVYSETELEEFISAFTESFIQAFSEDYTILEQEAQPDGSVYVPIEFTAEGDAGDVDLIFQQVDTVVFVFYFVSTRYDELRPSWLEIIASYVVDAEAALAAVSSPVRTPPDETTDPAVEPAPDLDLPALPGTAESDTAPDPEPTPVPPTPVPPTATPAPAQSDGLAPEAGRSRLYVFNEFNQDLTFTINNQTFTIPPAGIDNPIPIDLDAGRYSYTVSIPGGAAGGEVDMAPDQSWAVGVRGDGAVYDPFQVYP